MHCVGNTKIWLTDYLPNAHRYNTSFEYTDISGTKDVVLTGLSSDTVPVDIKYSIYCSKKVASRLKSWTNAPGFPIELISASRSDQRLGTNLVYDAKQTRAQSRMRSQAGFAVAAKFITGCFWRAFLTFPGRFCPKIEATDRVTK